jgi:hypothetical protein
MHIYITDMSDNEHSVTCKPVLTINGRIINTVEEATEEIDRTLSVRNNEQSAWHFCPLFFRTDTSMIAFDARNVKSYTIIPDDPE